MIFYRLKLLAEGQPEYHATILDAKTSGKQYPRLMLDPLQLIEMVDVPTDKQGLLALLNGTLVLHPLRRWEFTKRGGLIEIDENGNKAIQED